jgi:hypothetical protein
MPKIIASDYDLPIYNPHIAGITDLHYHTWKNMTDIHDNASDS